MNEGDHAIVKLNIMTPHGCCTAGTRVKILNIGNVDSLVDDEDDPEESDRMDNDHYAIVQPEDSQTQFEVMLSDLKPCP